MFAGSETRRAVVDNLVKAVLGDVADGIAGWENMCGMDDDEILPLDETRWGSGDGWGITGFVMVRDLIFDTPKCCESIVENTVEYMHDEYCRRLVDLKVITKEERDDMSKEDMAARWHHDWNGPEPVEEPEDLQMWLPGFPVCPPVPAPPWYEGTDYQRVERFEQEWWDCDNDHVNYEIKAEYEDASDLITFSAQITNEYGRLDWWSLIVELHELTEEHRVWIAHGMKNFFDHA